MDLGVISVRYARALLKSSMLSKQEEKVYEDMKTMLGNYLHVPQLRTTIDNPMLDDAKKIMVLNAACGDKPTDLTKRFIKLVVDEGRGQSMQFMAAAYITLYRQQKNIISGKLITAAAVDPATERKMKQMVESRTNGTVEFQTEVNPDIIGGFILEYDTYRMDASVQHQLRDILTQLKK